MVGGTEKMNVNKESWELINQRQLHGDTLCEQSWEEKLEHMEGITFLDEVSIN